MILITSKEQAEQILSECHAWVDCESSNGAPTGRLDGSYSPDELMAIAFLMVHAEQQAAKHAIISTVFPVSLNTVPIPPVWKGNTPPEVMAAYTLLSSSSEPLSTPYNFAEYWD